MEVRTAGPLHRLHLLFGLNALGNNLVAQNAPEINNTLNDCERLSVLIDAFDEAPVDLQPVKWKITDIGKA